MGIKSPPRPLTKPVYETLKKGFTVHRIHLTTYNGNSFNPCMGGQTRFAPIVDQQGSCVPSLYGGDTAISAVYETIFHDVPITTSLKTVRKADIEIRTHSELATKRSMKLVSLRAPALRHWGIRKNNLVGTTEKLYYLTAKWAEAIHHDFPRADGLVWTSNQCDPDSAYLFFGDRVSGSDFSVSVSRDGKYDKSVLSDVRSFGKLANIFITV